MFVLTKRAYARIIFFVKTLTEQQKLEVRETCAHANLKRTVRSVTQHFDAALGQSGLHVTQFTLLVASSVAGPLPLGELAERLALDRTTLNRAVQPLERDGLLETRPGPHDSRVRLIQITPEGEAAIARAYPLWREAQKEVSSNLTPQEYAQLLGLLRRLEPGHGA